MEVEAAALDALVVKLSEQINGRKDVHVSAMTSPHDAAQADEDEYWRTHGWARLKRNVMMFVRATFERKADVAEEDMKMIQSLTAAMDED